MKHLDWTIVVLVLAIASAWCYFEVAALGDTRGHMVGFHPAVLFAAPAGIILALVILAMAAIRKSMFMAITAALPVALLLGPLFFIYQLGVAGWTAELSRHAEANEIAVSQTDFSGAEFEAVPYKDHVRMVPVSGFKWNNADEMTSTKEGVFHGFTVADVPHVYVCPLRNGCRGVAWIAEGVDVPETQEVHYEYSGKSNWHIWTMSLR